MAFHNLPQLPTRHSTLAFVRVSFPCGLPAAIDAIRRVLQTPHLPSQPRVATALTLLLPRVIAPLARGAVVYCVGQCVTIAA